MDQRTLNELMYRELSLCRVGAQELVVVLQDRDTRQSYADAMIAAIENRGARPLIAPLATRHRSPLLYRTNPAPPRVDELVRNDPVLLDVLERADMVIDLTATGITHTRTRFHLEKCGTKMLSCRESPEVLERMFPREELRARVERSTALIRRARRMQVFSEAGTELDLELREDTPVWEQYGYTDTPGRWDNFPGGFVACWPVEGSPSGRIVLDTGDAVLPLGRYVDGRVEFTVRSGYVVDIGGKSLDAVLLRRYFESCGDREGYSVSSHYGWGLDETASWEMLAVSNPQDVRGADLRAFEGNFMWSTGPNVDLSRETAVHVDFPMRNCTITLDGAPIVDKGRLVPEELRSH